MSELVSWSLTSLFSTNMAISETKLMSEKQKQPEACIVIYDISQGIVATRFRYGGTSDYDYITNLLLSPL